ncbi:MAG: cytochrome c [Lautropia sp.]
MLKRFERAAARLARPSVVAAFVVAVPVVAGALGWQHPAGAIGAANAQAAPAKPDVAKGQKIASEVCVACHAIDGNATAPVNPKLAGQHPAYLRKQLANFKPQPGKDKAERVNAVMAAFAAQLSAADMANVAAYYASQPLKPAAAAKPDLVQLGQSIYRSGIADKGVPACASCHGPSGKGIPAQYPHVAGQWAEYTLSQLKAFQAGTRANYAPMTMIALRLTDKEAEAVSDYIAGLR